MFCIGTAFNSENKHHWKRYYTQYLDFTCKIVQYTIYNQTRVYINIVIYQNHKKIVLLEKHLSINN